MIIKQGKPNWKYILIVFIVAVIFIGGFFAYQRWIEKQNIGGPELEIPK